MSIAHGFDPDVSPIYEDDDDHTQHSVHFSSSDTPRRHGRVSSQAERTLGTTRMLEESHSGHQFHRECVPEDPEEPEEEVPDSKEPEESDELVPDSTECLSHTFIILSAGCCLPIRHHLTKCLTEMGATIQKSVDHRTTHIVVDRYADEILVGEAMSRLPEPPLMVDITWIQECLDQRQRCEETDFSMRGAHFLKKTCKRLSNFREITPEQEKSIIWMEMDTQESQDPAELLAQIRQLSERIDALMNYAPIIRFEYHSPDCPTRQRFSAPPTEHQDRYNDNGNENVENQNQNKLRPQTNKLRNLIYTISSNSIIKRRRSFTGFILEHRRPEEDLEPAKIREQNRDSREIWDAPNHKSMGGKRRKIQENAQKNQEKNQKNSKNQKNYKKKPIPIRADDSDIQSALASLTISSSPTEPRGEPRPRELSVEVVDNLRKPLVPTKSNFINQLQAPRADDDDFISDVSAFHLQKKSKKKEKGAEPRSEEPEKNGVVFTGFSRDSPIEKRLKSILRRFKLNFSSEIDKNTRCVVSRHGKRTLMVLKGICEEIPIVKPQWLEESHEDSMLLPHDDYRFSEWRNLENSRIFEKFAKIWVAEECAAPAREDLCWMVEKCGGKITRKTRRAAVLIVPENWRNAKNHPEIQMCTPLFIIDSISKGELQEVENYLVEID